MKGKIREREENIVKDYGGKRKVEAKGRQARQQHSSFAARGMKEVPMDVFNFAHDKATTIKPLVKELEDLAHESTPLSQGEHQKSIMRMHPFFSQIRPPKVAIASYIGHRLYRLYICAI